MSERLKALNASRSGEFVANSSPKCPHCGEDFDIEKNDAWRLYDESTTHEVCCPDCDQSFSVNASARWSFSTDEQEE